MSLLGMLAVVACIAFSVASKRRAAPVRLTRTAELPAASAPLTAWQLLHHAHSQRPVPAVDGRFLAAEAGVALGLGLTRGLTVWLGEDDGHLARRYRLDSVLLWVVLGVAGVVLAVWAGHSGATLASGTNAVMLLLSVSELAELAAIAPRAAGRRFRLAAHRKYRGGSAPSAATQESEAR